MFLSVISVLPFILNPRNFDTEQGVFAGPNNFLNAIPNQQYSTFAAQTIPPFADATTAQKEQIEATRKSLAETVKTDEGCKAMCEEMMGSTKAKKRMCDIIAKDPECVKMMKHE